MTITGDFPANPYRRVAAPVMAPLAGYDDADDAFEAPPQAALAMLAGDVPHDPESAEPAGSIFDGAADALDAEASTRDLTPEEAAVVAELPPIETLTNDSDFTPFMSTKVPEFIRRKALRVLYQTHPILGFRDGLNDYDEDYNLIDKLIDAATQSSYKVGQGQEAALEKDEELPDTEENADTVKDQETPEIEGDPESDGKAAEKDQAQEAFVEAKADENKTPQDDHEPVASVKPDTGRDV